MREVLMVYREVSLETDTQGPRRIHTVSVDEKPGVQALGTVSSDLPPVPDEHSSLSRDYEYKRLGTLSILATLDLHDGHVTARVEEKHRSREFVALLKDLDTLYPPEARSGWSWTIIRPIFPRRPAPTLQPGPTGRICPYAQAWILAQSGRNPVSQDEPDIPPAYSG